MRVCRNLSVCRGLRGCVVTVGNFDGVHRGHRQVITTVVGRAKRLRAKSVVVTFHPHTQTLLSHGGGHAVLSTPAEKEKLLMALGIDAVVFIRFTRAIQKMDPQAFLENIIFKTLKPRAVVFGYDHRFGAGRSGDFSVLKAFCRKRGVSAARVSAFRNGERPVSSTGIREMVAMGKMAAAAEMLGRPYLVMGRVVKGFARGRSLGFPTANLRTPEGKLLFPDGVYAGSAETGGQTWPAVISMGTRPTFGLNRRALEAHLVGFKGNLYGKTLSLSLLSYLRPQRKLKNARTLAAWIRRDIAKLNLESGKN